MKIDATKDPAVLETSAGIAEQLELDQHAVEPLRHLFDVSRRDLFKLLGSGLIVGICVKKGLTQESGRQVNREDAATDLASWLHIGEDGKVTVFTGKAEMGQNIRTSLTQQVAEELRVPMSSITLVMADTDLTPFDMGTFGSRTTPQMGTRLRTVSANARGLLVEMAAKRWQVDPATLSAKDGMVVSAKAGKRISYGELTHGQKLVMIPEADPEPESPTQWHVAGSSAGKVDGKAFVTGAHQYTSDLNRPGMQHGKVFRPAAFNSKLISVDTKKAEQVSSVTVVHDGDFIGVVGPDLELAQKALALVEVQSQASQQISDSTLFDYLRKDVDNEARGFGGRGGNNVGSVETGMASAAKTLSQTYTAAYIQHAPLEPRAAVAEWQDGKLTVWTGTQRPFAVKEDLASAFHIPQDHVRVIVPDTGWRVRH